MNDAAAAIDVRGLSKRFGERTVVDALTLRVARGEICGFLGPNGSGKTTTIRMLCGLLEPDAGEGQCLGHDIRREARRIKRRVGYMTQRFGLYEDLSIEENLQFVARVYGMRQRREVVDGALQRLGLQSRRQQLAGSLSGGWKQRLALAACLLHEPELLLLDEPTAGVDPKARRDFWQQIHGLAAQGLTVLVSTHYMDEAERCHRLVYISYGRLLAAGTAAEVIAQAALHTWELHGVGRRQTLALRLPPLRQRQIGGTAARLGRGGGNLVVAPGGRGGQRTLGLQFTHARRVAVAAGHQFVQAQGSHETLLHQALLPLQRHGRGRRRGAGLRELLVQRLQFRRAPALAQVVGLRLGAFAARLGGAAGQRLGVGVQREQQLAALDLVAALHRDLVQHPGAGGRDVDEFGFGVTRHRRVVAMRRAGGERQRQERGGATRRAGGQGGGRFHALSCLPERCGRRRTGGCCAGEVVASPDPKSDRAAGVRAARRADLQAISSHVHVSRHRVMVNPDLRDTLGAPCVDWFSSACC